MAEAPFRSESEQLNRHSYQPLVNEHGWPAVGKALLVELTSSRGRVALVLDDDKGTVIAAFSELLGETPRSVGRTVTEGNPPQSAAELIRVLSGSRLLIDVDVLFWRPWLQLDPIALVRTLARRSGQPVLTLWPGTVSAREVAYSTPGRQDYYRAALEDAVLLRSRHRVFPDDVPYTVERI